MEVDVEDKKIIIDPIEDDRMRIDVLTLFPEMFATFKAGMVGRSMDKGLVTINEINIRDFQKINTGEVDDYPLVVDLV